MYDYRQSVKMDVSTWVLYNVDLDEWKENREGLEEYLNETLWTVDSVTGNGSGSYTCNTYKAEENLCHNWELIEEVASEFGYKPTISAGYENGPEWWDVSIRCYLLGGAIAEVLDDYEDSGAFETETEVASA